jgi:hypothetical protein
VRVKTSVTLPSGLLSLARLEKAKKEARDARIINANAGRLNKEARDVLEYQGLP